MEYSRKQSKTRQSFFSALCKLCQEKSFYDITINDLCTEANLHRSSFYRYYEDKNDLLRDYEEEYLAQLRKIGDIFYDPEMKWMNDPDKCRQTLTELYRYHRKEKETFSFLFGQNGDPFFFRQMSDVIAVYYKSLFRESAMYLGKDEEYYLEFLLKGSIAVLNMILMDDSLSENQAVSKIMNMTVELPKKILRMEK